jgi:hypothetical protein
VKRQLAHAKNHLKQVTKSPKTLGLTVTAGILALILGAYAYVQANSSTPAPSPGPGSYSEHSGSTKPDVHEDHTGYEEPAE